MLEAIERLDGGGVCVSCHRLTPNEWTRARRHVYEYITVTIVTFVNGIIDIVDTEVIDIPTI